MVSEKEVDVSKEDDKMKDKERYFMARRRVAYRKKNQNRFSMLLVTLVVIMISIVVAVKSVELRQKIDAVATKENQLKEQIAEEEKRAEEIEEFRKEVQTKGYMEEVAKDKLGLVYEGEIIFKEED